MEEISKDCVICVDNASPRRRLKMPIGMHDVQFNSIVAYDIMKLDGKHVLYVVDEATHFQAAGFLRNDTSEEVWRIFVIL